MTLIIPMSTLLQVKRMHVWCLRTLIQVKGELLLVLWLRRLRAQVVLSFLLGI
jgi:hypothetical protein